MKFFKYIALFILLIQATTFFSQNKRGVLPSPQNLPPEVNFSWDNSCYGYTTCFINQTIRGNTYTWTVTEDTTIGIGPVITKTLLVSNDTNICFHFWKPGTYTISLDAYNNHFANNTQVIIIDTVTKADFSFVHCSNVFANKSTCASTFLWDFGDGNQSAIISPIHQYADTGHYTITLIAFKGMISDTIKKQLYVDVESFANTVFTHIVSHGTLFVQVTPPSSVTNYYWSFGDGINATGSDTFHVYKDSTAMYGVGLVAVNACGPAFKTDSISIIQELPPMPNFSFTNTCLGDTTCFINQSTHSITYTWTVTNTGSPPDTLYTSHNTNMCFRFPTIGNYSVTLNATNLYYLVSSTQTITIDTFPKANFNFTLCSNDFVNTATCAKSFYWDFGDGSHSTLMTPNHQYADTGYYSVSFIAYNGITSDTITKYIHVSVTSSANANFTTNLTSNNTLQVHAIYSGIPNAIYNWNFGDGTTATGKDTVHVYADTNLTYHVKLTVTNLCGSVFTTDTIQIIIPKPPSHLDFSNSILTIVPNPATDDYINTFFNAYAPAKYLTQVYNSLGQKVFEENFIFDYGINSFKISTANLSTGIYTMILQSGNSFIRKKFYVINKSN